MATYATCMGCLEPTRWHVARIHHSSIHKGNRSHKGLRRAAIVGPEEGEYIPIRKHKRQDGVPSLELTKEDAVQIQLAVRVVMNLCSCAIAAFASGESLLSTFIVLQALQNNDYPYHDAGVELVYR